jgi:tRNA A37 threonylcarbamoyladenosine dehydratase
MHLLIDDAFGILASAVTIKAVPDKSIRPSSERISPAQDVICKSSLSKASLRSYSREEALVPQQDDVDPERPAGRRSTPGSVSFVPPVAGFIIAGEVVKDLIA